MTKWRCMLKDNMKIYMVQWQGTSSLGSFSILPVLGELVGRPDYRLNAVLLRGIMTSSLIACSCAIWINLGSCMHLNLNSNCFWKLQIAFSEIGRSAQEIGWTAVRMFRFLVGGWRKTEVMHFSSETLLRIGRSDLRFGWTAVRSFRSLVGGWSFPERMFFCLAKPWQSDGPDYSWRSFRPRDQRLCQFI